MASLLRRWGLIPLAWVLIAGCQQQQEPPGPSVELRDLANMLTGSFTSSAQAEADSSFSDIRLEVVPIWGDRTDGPWLYVEQAAASALDRPYRQRVYRLSQPDDSTFRSDVYTLAEPLRFAGAWREPARFDILTPDSLELREDCSIILYPEGRDAYVGGTVGIGCESTLRGALYATSDVRITPLALYSWDRGFDSSGIQVWGAETGGYVFAKIESGIH